MLITWLRDQCSRGCQGLVSFNCSLFGYNTLAKIVSKSKQTACWCHFIFTNIFLFPGSAIDFFCYLKEDVHEFFHWWKNNFLSSRMLLCPFPPSGWLFQSQIYLKKDILKVHSELKNFGKKCNCFCLRLKSTVFLIFSVLSGYGVKNFKKTIYFSLWSNCATTRIITIFIALFLHF